MFKVELKTIEDKKRRLVFDISGANHGFCNVLKDALWQVKGVTIASYSIDHPQTGIPRFVLETDTSAQPKEAIKKAVAALKSDAEKFKAEAKSIK